jgi:hypothetical protein
MNWHEDKEWTERWTPQIIDVIRSLAHRIVDVKAALPDQDRNHATDYIIKVEVGDIACRLRRIERCPRLDFTIRSHRPSQVKTELQKLQEGFARFYLYGWIERESEWHKWVFVDLNRCREYGLFRRLWRSKTNRDGTQFIFIPWSVVASIGAVIAISKAMEPVWEYDLYREDSNGN